MELDDARGAVLVVQIDQVRPLNYLQAQVKAILPSDRGQEPSAPEAQFQRDLSAGSG
ncbi:MAG TPA: hypothetical protein VFG15_16450 [Amycolatopsis sp.]|nr:hypothetical protein [Amycolatopsis sp.]